MKLQKRYIAFALVIVLLFLIQFNHWSDDYSRVTPFRGAQLEADVFYPLIARSMNEGHSVQVSVDGEPNAALSGEVYVNSGMQILGSAAFFRDVMECDAHVYNKKTLRIQRGNVILTYTKNSQTRTRSLADAGDASSRNGSSSERSQAQAVCTADESGRLFAPIQDLCDEFGYSMSWDSTAGILQINTDGADENSLPEAFDLRSEKRTAAIRDQGSESTCWAFASIGALESSILPERTDTFSPEDLIAHKPYSFKKSQGGDFSLALAYLLSWQGPVSEKKKETAVHLQSAAFYDHADEEEIKRAVFLYGGVSTSVYIQTGGVSGKSSSYYNDETNAYCYNGSQNPNHDIVIIGWDDHYPASNFNVRVRGNGAFLCQNSWGSDFGDDGVFYVSYYDAAVGTQAVSYCDVEPADNYDVIHQSDLGGWTGQIGYGQASCMGANLYMAEADESVCAAGFYALGKNTEYELFFVPDYQSDDSLAKRIPVASGTLESAGYYTIPFSAPQAVADGTTFAVVLSIRTPGVTEPMAIEYTSARMADEVDITDGDGRISADGTYWEDVEDRTGGNLCLKAYADQIDGE